MEGLEKIIRFYQRSQLTRFVVLGGEPTLHPAFNQMIDRILTERDFKSIIIFTNGLMPENVLAYLSGNTDPRLRIALNLNASDDYIGSQWLRINETLKALTTKVGLGINVYKPGQDYNYLIDAIKQHNLSRHIRVGLTQPVIGSKNIYALENDFPVIAEDLLRFAEKAYHNNIDFSFDCGFRYYRGGNRKGGPNRRFGYFRTCRPGQIGGLGGGGGWGRIVGYRTRPGAHSRCNGNRSSRQEGRHQVCRP